MVVGIDTSHLGYGGGVTHIFELLKGLDISSFDIRRVVVWGDEKYLSQLEEREWLDTVGVSHLNDSIISRLFWLKYGLDKEAKRCVDVLFVPGGIFLGSYSPFVTMIQNSIPFNKKERARYGLSMRRARFAALRILQCRTANNANGAIFLTETSRSIFKNSCDSFCPKNRIIPHGVSSRFSPCSSDVEGYNNDGNYFSWLYVSPVKLYKHQWNVVKACSILRSNGYNAKLNLVGGNNRQALDKLNQVLEIHDPIREFVEYHGRASYQKIHDFYKNADAFVFASTCETFGMVLAEAMQAGLPIACSNQSAVPDVVQGAGIYFDPHKPHEIADAMALIMDNSDLRRKMKKRSLVRSGNLSWRKTAQKTFSFLSRVAQKNN